jgi:hypothetical protein
MSYTLTDQQGKVAVLSYYLGQCINIADSLGIGEDADGAIARQEIIHYCEDAKALLPEVWTE